MDQAIPVFDANGLHTEALRYPPEDASALWAYNAGWLRGWQQGFDVGQDSASLVNDDPGCTFGCRFAE